VTFFELANFFKRPSVITGGPGTYIGNISRWISDRDFFLNPEFEDLPDCLDPGICGLRKSQFAVSQDFDGIRRHP